MAKKDRRGDEVWEKLYDTYKTNYKKESMKRSKATLEKMYDKNMFKTMYTALENTREEEIRQGKRKVANIQQDLVRKQREYDYSLKQAKNIQEALLRQKIGNEKLEELTKKEKQLLYKKEGWQVQNIRLSKSEAINQFKDDIKASYHNFRNAGLTSKEAAKKIGQIFFGSPE